MDFKGIIFIVVISRNSVQISRTTLKTWSQSAIFASWNVEKFCYEYSVTIVNILKTVK